MKTKSTFVCPYCFDECKLSDVQFRCTNKRCIDVPDKEMTAYAHGDLNNPIQNKTTFNFDNNRFGVPKSAECPECHNTTYKRVCPSCHNELPESTLTGRDMIISIVGSRASGKSHFVGVMIKELRDRISVSFGGSLEGFADSYQRWQRNFGSVLYDGKQTLDQTKSSLAQEDTDFIKPLIFKFKLPHKSFFHKQAIESFTFVFFDTAGEDLNDEDTMSTVNKYICKSAGIIFLLDPMQIPAVVSQLDQTTVQGATASSQGNIAEADDIMTRVSKLIRNDKKMGDSAKINIPVAAVFSKFDAIESIVPPDCTVLRPSPHCDEQHFDLTDGHNVDSEILALLHEWHADAFISQLDVNYSKFSYFAISALGLHNNPTSEGKIEMPRPHRIEDPFLWLLKENGVIKGK